MKRLLLGCLRLYQLVLSPWIGNQCRFYPTCSEYARRAIETHGSVRGSVMAVMRLCKCHPWHPGGFDPVPGYHDPNLDDDPAPSSPAHSHGQHPGAD